MDKTKFVSHFEGRGGGGGGSVKRERKREKKRGRRGRRRKRRTKCMDFVWIFDSCHGRVIRNQKYLYP